MITENHNGVAVVIRDRADRADCAVMPRKEYVEIEHGRLTRDATDEARFVSVRAIVCTAGNMVYPVSAGTSTHDGLENALTWGRGRVAQAVELLPQVRRICQAERFRGKRLSRDEYEIACRALGVITMLDAEIDSYAVKYGIFSLPHYNAEQIVRMTLARARLDQIEAERSDEGLCFMPFDTLPDRDFHRPDTSATDKPCARCGSRRSLWVAGAGEALCAKHQDDY